MAITVNPDGLAADGAVLADWQTLESPPGCQPAGADSVSVGVAAQLSAHSTAAAILVNHAQQLRFEGGAVTQHTAASLLAIDEAGAAVVAGTTSGPGAISAPTAPVAVPAPVLPEIPPIPPPATIPGEAQAVALYSGHGAASLRQLANGWQSLAATLDNVAAETSQTAASIDAHWIDGIQQAGANTAAHGTWLSDMAAHVGTLAAAAHEAADHYDRAIAATPKPQEFTDAHTWLAKVTAANVASHGLLSSQVHHAAAQLAQLQSQAADAASAYYTAAVATLDSIAGTPAPAPPIARGSGSGTAHTQGGNDTVGSAQPASGPGVTGATTNAGTTTGTNTDTGGGSLGAMAESLLPAATVLPMMAMAPMSALSGLSGISHSGAPTLANRFASRPDEAAPDLGLPDDAGDTMPAASGGGGAEAVSGVSPPPVSRPSSPSPVSGPGANVGIAAEGAATAPAAAVEGGGIGPYPPMMGASGAGDGGGHRDMRLYPDRRMVARPVPNSEAVFGELQRERRPRARANRAAPGEATRPGEGTNEG
jgi:hypothetical protein